MSLADPALCPGPTPTLRHPRKAGFSLALKTQLYRVEIHDGADVAGGKGHVQWSRDKRLRRQNLLDGAISVTAPYGRTPGRDEVLRLRRRPVFPKLNPTTRGRS